MPLELQTSLLRVLQTKEIVRIGGKQKKKIDVRIMAATNVDLLQSVQKKEFRSDLYYRINVLSIEVPPLRDRKSDILLLTNHFISSISRMLEKRIDGITSDAEQLLYDYNWPGNIRELENVIERAVNLASGHIITKEDLPPAITYLRIHPRKAGFPFRGNHAEADRGCDRKPELQTPDFRTADEHGNVSKASERLGIPRRTLYRRIKKYNINIDEFRLL